MRLSRVWRILANSLILPEIVNFGQDLVAKTQEVYEKSIVGERMSNLTLKLAQIKG